MNIKEIINGYLGNTQVKRIYQGSKLVWSKYFDNKYMIGGTFTTFNGSTQNKLVRLNKDGTKDTSFNIGTGFNYDVKAIDIDTINQKLYVGGNFSTYNGSTRSKICRLNMGGSIDTSFGVESNKNVYAIKIDTINQKIYVGGAFTIFNGGGQNRLIRLNMNGSKDTSFNIGTGFDGDVNAIGIDTINQKIYVAGAFITYNGSTQNRIVRLNMDGSKDNTFNIGTGFGGTVYAMNVDTINQKIYVGGYFTTYNGSTRSKICRLNMGGSIDNTFNIGAGFNNNVYAIKIDTINQKIYVGGTFTTYNGSTQNCLVRLNMDGTKDTSFNIGTGFNYDVNAIGIDTINQKIYVGGYFTTYNGSTRSRICRLNMNGSIDNTFNIQLDSGVNTILKYTEE